MLSTAAIVGSNPSGRGSAVGVVDGPLGKPAIPVIFLRASSDSLLVRLLWISVRRFGDTPTPSVEVSIAEFKANDERLSGKGLRLLLVKLLLMASMFVG